MRILLTVTLVLSLVVGTIQTVESSSEPDPLCLLFVANDIYQRAARAALAETKDPEQAAVVYRERMVGLTEKSPLRRFRDPSLTMEEIVQKLPLAARECPAWAKLSSADPLIRSKVLAALAKITARRQPLLFASAISDMFDAGTGGGRKSDKERLGPGHILDFDARERLLLGAWGAAFALNAAAIGVAVQLGLLTPAQGAQLVQAISAAGAAAMGAIAAGSALLDGVRDREGGEGR